MDHTDYFAKITQAPTPDLAWNIPETKKGTASIIGGNSQHFRTEVKISEFFGQHYPIQTLNTILPDALKSKLPDLPNFLYLTSTDSGSFADAEELTQTINSADYNLLLGDFSKNSITAVAISTALQHANKPTIVTRDTIDLLAEHGPERTLMNDQLIYFASMPQLQKLFRAVYYPKMILLSSSLIQVADALHKFTLSYPAKIITLHSGQILIAENGIVKAIPLEKSGYPPLTFWQGELAAKITALSLYNPNNFIGATISAIFS